MIIIGVPALICIVGAFVYILSTNGKAVELGRIMFFCGLLAILLAFPDAVKLLR
jgi:Na+/phosphate symporter